VFNSSLVIKKNYNRLPFRRTSTSALKDAVPVLADYKTLKSQFDWLFDGEVSHLIFKNLGREIENIELFLRLVFLLLFDLGLRVSENVYTV
jgi:hypothetical protein